jgi:hypothetical protein
MTTNIHRRDAETAEKNSDHAANRLRNHQFNPLSAACGLALVTIILAASILRVHAQEQNLPPAPQRFVTTVTPKPGFFTEPSIAVNPLNPQQVVAAFQDNAHIAYSTDAGRTWQPATGIEPPDYRVSGDVSVTFDDQGHAIICYMAFNRLGTYSYWGHNSSKNGLHIRRSMDGGQTWEADHIPVIVQPESPTSPWEDKPYIVADQSKGPFHGNLYIGWTRWTLTDSEMMFVRSTDDGKTWSKPIEIDNAPGLPRDDNGALEGFDGAVGPDSTLYAVWADGNCIYLTTSSDGGRTFVHERKVIKTAPIAFSVQAVARANGFPQIGVDPRGGGKGGRLYITWSDYRNGDIDVFCSTSADHGETWSPAVRVNSDSLHNGDDQFFQWSAVDPSDGSAYVVFYDRRGDPQNRKQIVTLARSTDGGRTFQNYAWTDEAFDAKGVFMGDYTGITALNGRVYGVWTEKPQDAPGRDTVVRVGVADFGSKTTGLQSRSGRSQGASPAAGAVIVHRAMKYDVSRPLALIHESDDATAAECVGAACGTSPGALADASADDPDAQERREEPIPPPTPAPTLTPAGIAVEQTVQGKRPAAPLIESFDGLGAGFEGPQGTTNFRNPSDSSLAVGPDHIVQIVNSRIAIYSKKGKKYDKTGTVLYGAVATKSVWAGFGGVCEARNSGDAVVRYDQLAGRWLIVMPMFSRIGPDEFPGKTDLAPGEPVPPGQLAKSGQASSPGAAAALPPNPPQPPPPPERGQRPPEKKEGVWGMCYAVSTGPDPLGTYYRYVFERVLFPDYPRPAIWTDGYYIPTSTGDDVIQKHSCIADRAKMLAGQPATEQCIVIDGVNFLNNADIDGQKLPPAGAPNIMMAAGGTQLKKIFEDDGIYYWKVHVDWKTPASTKADGPVKIAVAPYHYLCNGQLTSCVPQPGTERRLDVQGDKIMQRLVYRKVGGHESIVAAHSIYTQGGGGGVRWYEFRLDKQRDPVLYQQGTYAPEGFFRWMPSIDMDKKGDIGVGYSFGGTPNFTGQRFAAQKAGDTKGTLSFHETVLANGEAAQTNTLRWEDYVTTAMDPSDDCTFWYVGDYFKAGDMGYRTKIGAFRLPNCKGGR